MGRYAIFNGLVYGGGTAVIPNPEGTPTDELHSLQIGEDIYEIVGGGGANVIEKTQAEYDALTPAQKANGSIYMVKGSQELDNNYSYYSAENDTIIVRVYHEGESDQKIEWFFREWNQTSGDMTVPSNLTAYLPSTPQIATYSANYPNATATQNGWIGFYGGSIRAWTQDLANTTTGIMYGVVDIDNGADQTNPYIDDPYTYVEGSNKIYYMGTEYANTNGGSGGGGSQELISYDTTITTTQYGWWTAEDKDGNTLDPDQYELIAVTPIVNNSSSWTGSWDGAFYINTVDGVTHRYDVTFVNINDGGYIRTSRTWDIKVVYRDKNAAGGGGSSTVVPNPEEEPTDTLNTVEIDGVVYDIEGSGGGGTSEGEGVEIYSEDEYIVGKWIDGKKLYQRTFSLPSAIILQANDWTTINNVVVQDANRCIQTDVYLGADDSQSSVFGKFSNGVLSIFSDIPLSINAVTLRYTKTVETPAPAWGGSVTNNYASFIDTDNVIDSGVYNPTTPLSYTAAEDCFMVIVLIANNNPCIVSVDNKEIYRLYDNGVGSITAPIPLKKDQTITATTSYSAEDSPYTVYGITYASGGSDSGSSKIEYSTEEKEVGTWIDGSSIYQKTFVLSSPVALTSGDWTIISEVNIPNADASIYTEVFYSSAKTQLTAAGRFDNGVLSIFLPFKFRTDKVTVRYTKTTT